MIRQYYKLEGEPAQSVLHDYCKLIKPLINKRSEIISEFKEDFNIQGEVLVRPRLMGQHVAIGISALKAEQTPFWATKREINTNTKDTTYILLTPCVETMKGQIFQNWLDKINRVRITTFSSFAIEKILGGQKSLMDGGAKHYAVAGFHNAVDGFHNGVLVISVPTKSGGYPNIKYGYTIGRKKYKVRLKEIKKSEYIAITGGS